MCKLAYNLLKGCTTYLHRGIIGVDPFTKYHGHPSTMSIIGPMDDADNLSDIFVEFGFFQC